MIKRLSSYRSASMISKQQTPQIRLTGFSEDWVQKKLVDEVIFFSGLTYTPSDVVDKLGTLVLRSSNVQKGAITLGDNVYVNSEVVNSQNVEVGDIIVVVRNGSRNLIGKHAMITKPMTNTVIGAFMTGIRAPVPSFFNTLLDTQEFDDEVSKNLGATINQITGGMFKSMSFYLPESNEQTAIGNLFQNIDQTISLQRRKHEQTQTLKKSLLGKMFPKKGQVQPEIRLTGFSGDWTEVKLGEISDTTIGEFVIKSKQSPNGAYPVYNGGISYTGLYDDFNNEANKIVISARGANAGFVNIVRRRYWAGNSCYSVSIDTKEISIDFLYYFIKENQYLFTNFQQAANIPSVSKGDVEKFNIVLPNSREEQTAIGQLFKKLDDTISLQAKQLKTLENLKKALLAKMFV